MGYYTTYRLQVNSQNANQIIQHFRNLNSEAEYSLDENGYPDTESKWYNAEYELALFSQEYPDVLFELHGDGEELDDRWVTFVKNGLSYRKSKIYTPEFDEQLLQPPYNYHNET